MLGKWGHDSGQAVESRKAFLELVDHRYRTLYNGAEHANMDGFREQAWKMLLNPEVQQAFDLEKEPEKLRDRYGCDTVGQSALLARRLVEAGARFVTAAEFRSNIANSLDDTTAEPIRELL